MIDYIIVGKNIAANRQALGLTQEELAENLDISSAYIKKIEKGQKHPSLNLLEDMTSFFKIDIFALIVEPEEFEKSNASINPILLSKISHLEPETKRMILEISDSFTFLDATITNEKNETSKEHKPFTRFSFYWLFPDITSLILSRYTSGIL